MKKTYTPILCLLSQNGKGRLDFPTNGLKKALCGRDWVVMDWVIFEAGRLLTFPTYRVGAYSRWALNRINTVIVI